MPKAVDDCVKSVMEDNPDMSESRAYAICNAMENEGQLSDGDPDDAHVATILRQVEGAAALSDADRGAIKASDTYSDKILDEDPCWEDYVMVGTKTVNGQEVPNCVPEDEADPANMTALAAADDRCGEGMVEIGGQCVPVEQSESPPPSSLAARTLAEFDEGDAVTWDWQGETVHGRVREVRDEQATVSGDVTIEGDPDDEEPVYVIDEYDDAAGGFRSGNVAKPEASLDESQRDLPDRSDDNMLAAPHHLTLKSLDTEPIERVAEGGNTIRYRNLKLLSPGVWADAGSEMATYYPPEGIENLQAEYSDDHDGPPVNIMHDLDMEDFEAHEASVAGHVDPETLATDDEGNLFGDIVINTDTGAGQFADENLQSTLENEGTVGFGGPSVEIPAEGLQQSHDAERDMPRVDGGLLSGVALVMDPASKSVSFAKEAARRPVALSGSGDNVKVLSRQSDSMSQISRKTLADKLTLMDADEIRETLSMFGFDGLDDMTDDEVMDMAEDLHEDLMADLEGDTEMGDYGDEEEDDEEDTEMEDGEDMEEDEEDDEMEMADDDIGAMQDRVQNLASRLEDLEDAVAQAMTADDVGSELAAADSVEELDKRLSQLEDQPKDSKTLADGATVGDDEDGFEPSYENTPSSTSGW